MIDIPTQLIHLRAELIEQKHAPLMWRLGFKGWRLGMSSHFLYSFGAKMARWFMKIGSRDGWKSRLPFNGAIWTAHRDIPVMPKKPFHKRWADLQRELESEDGN
jgi:hypothetical protein